MIPRCGIAFAALHWHAPGHMRGNIVRAATTEMQPSCICHAWRVYAAEHVMQICAAASATKLGSYKADMKLEANLHPLSLRDEPMLRFSAAVACGGTVAAGRAAAVALLPIKEATPFWHRCC